ncbi:hypothetical protein HMPREF9441_02063 [Paraprevotella clara YIT 11840]|uniref:Uncharacterized protein n=1 Tax=Paraprevotella clara YIT 11840 TaxID=762968 RepID=G5SRR5_9BACT|nr:hypothetical protein HMPREF9441_02063 [Paraprevotella clara YIT 11840]
MKNQSAETKKSFGAEPCTDVLTPLPCCKRKEIQILKFRVTPIY